MNFRNIRKKLSDALDQSAAIGSNGLSENCHFIPRKLLDEIMSPAVVNKLVLEAEPRVPDPSAVAKNYRTVLSVLIYIRRPHQLFEFVRREIDDSNLPLQIPAWPSRFDYPNSGFGITIRQFYDFQWPFCPLDFLGDSIIHKRVLHANHILPIAEKRPAMRTNSEGAAVYEVVVNNMNQPAEQDKGPERFALKVYSADQKETFEKETKMFAALVQNPLDPIVRYYGSFIQGNSYNILLEFGGGTLEDFLEGTTPPVGQEEIVSFWGSCFSLASAMGQLHSISVRNVGRWGLYGDIKPDNILWFKDDAGSKQSCFKIADFGFANVADAQPEPTNTTRRPYQFDTEFGSLATTNYSTVQGNMHHREKGGPDYRTHLNRGEKRLSAVKARDNTAVDIWSLGCVLSECAVWVLGGYSELKSYRQSRRDELINKAFNPDDRWPSFHDGSGLLSSVEVMFGDMRSKLEGHDGGDGDTITLRIVDMLQKEVLVPHDKRRIRPKDMFKVFRPADTETEGIATGQNDWGLDLNSPANWKKGGRMRWGYGARTSSLRGY